jgi:hypothetical protein
MDTDAQVREVLENARPSLAAAVAGWRAAGGTDEDLAIRIDGLHSATPSVIAMTRSELRLHIPAFDPTVAIELAQHPAHSVPVVVDLSHIARRIVWLPVAALERGEDA